MIEKKNNTILMALSNVLFLNNRNPKFLAPYILNPKPYFKYDVYVM